MGAVLWLESGTREPLRARTRLGRAADSTVRLHHAGASRDHAVIAWISGRWEVRDLGSANGTWLDGRRLSPGVPVELGAGSVLGFGLGSGELRVVDISPPAPLATRDDGERVEGMVDVLDLFAGELSVTVWREPAGRWRAEGAVERAVRDGDSLSLGGSTWTLCLPDAEATQPTERDGREIVPSPAIPLEVGAFHPDLRVVRAADGEIVLSPTEARLLAYLADRGGEPVSQRELLARVWGYRASVETRTVYVTANRLRRKIERDPQAPRHLMAVPGVGYCFIPLASAAPADR